MWDQFVAGVVAGGTTTLVLHPLDLLKTRFQVDVNKSKRPLLYTCRSIVAIRRQYGTKALYQGLSANLAGSTCSWGLYFLFYGYLKKKLSRHGAQEISPTGYFVAAGGAGAMTVAFTNPLWVVKTRMCLQNPGQSGNYTGLFDAIMGIGRNEGLRGLYRGFIPGLFGVSHGAVQFTVYERLKLWRTRRRGHPAARAEKTCEALPPPQPALSTIEYLGMAASSKCIAGTITYPYQVVRSRLQIRQDINRQLLYRGILDLLQKTFKHEGIGGFYKGLVPATLRVLPGTCITFVVYENVSALLKSHYGL